MALVMLLTGCAGSTSGDTGGRSDARRASLRASEGHEASSRSSLSRSSAESSSADHGSSQASQSQADTGHGAPAAAVANSQLHAERILAERELKGSEERFGSLGASAPIGIFQTDSVGG